MGRKGEGGWSRFTQLAGCGAVELRRGFILEADDNESYRISTPGVNTFRESWDSSLCRKQLSFSPSIIAAFAKPRPAAVAAPLLPATS